MGPVNFGGLLWVGVTLGLAAGLVVGALLVWLL